MLMTPPLKLTSILIMCTLLLAAACKSEPKANAEDAEEPASSPSMSAEPSTEQAAKRAEDANAPAAAANDNKQPEAENTDGVKGHVTFLRRSDKGDTELFVMNLEQPEATLIFSHKDDTNSNVLFPHWSEDSSRITFQIYDKKDWTVASVKPDGADLTLHADKQVDSLSRSSRADDITVDEGKLTIKGSDGKQVLIYEHEGYDMNDNPGPAEASWSPDKTHLIFEVCGESACAVRITDLTGKTLRTISGASSPDWSR
jgi:hypothetical protein